VLPTSFLRIPKTQPHFITGMNANVSHFCSFCKPTFSGATREWDALYKPYVYKLIQLNEMPAYLSISKAFQIEGRKKLWKVWAMLLFGLVREDLTPSAGIGLYTTARLDTSQC
jgi:hypothetical protein